MSRDICVRQEAFQLISGQCVTDFRQVDAIVCRYSSAWWAYVFIE